MGELFRTLENKEIFLVLGKLFVVPGIQPGSAVCKTNTLPFLLSVSLPSHKEVLIQIPSFQPSFISPLDSSKSEVTGGI